MPALVFFSGVPRHGILRQERISPLLFISSLLGVASVVTDLLLDRAVLPSCYTCVLLSLELYDGFVFFGPKVRLAVLLAALEFS